MFSPTIHPLTWYEGRRITVMGLGLFGGGRGVTEFLCRQGADVTVTDLRPASELEPTLVPLERLAIRWVLGEHREEDFLRADLVIPSPAVPRNAPMLQLCRENGIPLDTEMNLFFKHCRGKICGVTGSNGKTTTTSLIGAIAAQRWPDVRVGGNLGRSLLPTVERIRPGDWVVLELSSFQLEDLASLERRPEVSVVTNLTPNHLDRHGAYEDYIRAKREIVGPGPVPDVAVLNGDDTLVRAWADESARHVIYFGRTGAVTPVANGVWYDETQGVISWSDGGRSRPLFPADALQLRGRFNVINASAAAAAGIAMGLGDREIRQGIEAFRGVEHRLETVGERDGVEYVNDSIATTPESTIAALEALGSGEQASVVLICGGSSKGCSFSRLGTAIAAHAREVFLIGTTACAIEKAVLAARRTPPVHRVGTLEIAMAAVGERSRPGDVVLLSPACPSYDQFTNFEERGNRFKDLVTGL